MEKTYCLSESARKVHKNNFATEKEALEKALECARVLNRGISVYCVFPAGANTQNEAYPTVPEAIQHVAMVFPNGAVRRGTHPAIELLNKDAPNSYVQPVPYAIGNYDRILNTLDTVAAKFQDKGSLDLAEQTFATADFLLRFSKEVAPQEPKEVQVTAEVAPPEKPSFTDYANLFKVESFFSNEKAKIQINAFYKEEGIVDFLISGENASKTFKTKHSAKAPSLARVLLKSGFSPCVLAEEDVQSFKDLPLLGEEKKEKSNEPETEESDAKKHDTLLSYCMDLCGNNIAVADDLSKAFIDAFSSKRPIHTVSQLRSMSSFRGVDLPDRWFDTAKETAISYISKIKNLTRIQANVKEELINPSPEVKNTVRSAVKTLAKNRSLKDKTSSMAKTHAQKILADQPLSVYDIEKMHVFLASAKASEGSPLEYALWGGTAGKNWANQALQKLEALATEVSNEK